jgi:hypothetical protein
MLYSSEVKYEIGKNITEFLKNFKEFIFLIDNMFIILLIVNS